MVYLCFSRIVISYFVKNAITTEEELTKQFLSLLVIQNFSSTQASVGAGSVTGAGSGMAGVTTSELLSNQLSNWLSQISDDFDIGVDVSCLFRITQAGNHLVASLHQIAGEVLAYESAGTGDEDTHSLPPKIH